MGRVIFYFVCTFIGFAIFGLAVLGIRIASKESVSGVFVYLSILGIVAGLGGGITFFMQAIRALKKRA
ncbi:MAG: hypothetical protein A3F26_02125 [Candidatus Ryanbacteria bacterium RIFCSPHIGHO2_12_FULL_47_12b]|uniref:Uncharacterized protein n=2 Tax=Candidatus Ryaniibacteriota TaxID=1817914 RepID=A0A1G2H789_9BACT|nr:MAG: hypothetical protein UX74_C0006G0012 [Parcubacteria group bacterium GW2011_GWA2_47_10b]OGZ46661.1 MAG: hypothetical protein A2844_00860 [Candidatus Ryanbacteria bacterium RIFCSPHIGHO2_01_FULL_48_80]OGZ53039.1 MAG: hypothetical protein A3A29_01185 [Candidatus Ryanbacteria bacterium RIFCSPLOWO2_01_FULL_47_79]OGZ53362.1 MAG: hypothetical protein A3F26_02125 [Candidatus Ryanbacteria bacterium RIFCSPHIGHO2_12_FULL_47_12b]OGZ57042.1 MAG: hypothetical protein A3J04_00565 [Candidatus Ryanbacter